MTQQTDKLVGLTELARCAGWLLPHKNICWASERHCVLNRDDRGRLHSTKTSAVLYPDGWAIYAVHGVLVPEEVIIEPEKITVEQIRSERNAEIKRIMIEQRGWNWYLKTTEAKVLHRRKNTIEGTEEALMQHSDGTVLVCACPSTARVYALAVPNNVETCEQAQRYLSGGLCDRIVSAS